MPANGGLSGSGGTVIRQRRYWAHFLRYNSCCKKSLSHFHSNCVHYFLAHPFFFGNTQIPEDLSAVTVIWLIRHTRNDVKMHVRMFRGLSKLDHIRFYATSDFFQGE